MHITEPFEYRFALLVHAVIQRSAFQFVRDFGPLRSLFRRRSVLCRCSRSENGKNAHSKKPKLCISVACHLLSTLFPLGLGC